MKENKVICERCIERKVKNPREAVCVHYKFWREKPLIGDHRLAQKGKPELFQNLCALCHAEIHGTLPNKSELKRLVILRDRSVRAKISQEHVIKSLQRIEYMIPEEQQLILDSWKVYIESINKQIEKELKDGSKIGKYPLHDRLIKVHGIGIMSAAKLQAYIDISKSENAGKLISFCGLNPDRIKRRKGLSKTELLSFGNSYLKKELLGVIAENFVRKRTPIYREVYDNEKKQELSKVYPEGYLVEHCNLGKEYKISDVHISKGHAHHRAIRKMMQIFIQHYYNNDREVNGLPVRKPYVEEKLNHTGIIQPNW